MIRLTKSEKWGEELGPGRSIFMAVNTRKEGITLGLEGYQSWVNLLLVFVPVGILAGLSHWNQTFVFLANFLAIVPLAMILGKATEDIAAHTNDTVGGLLNATFGNAVELILCIQALRQGELDIVQATLVGSILSNLLLVLGCSFLFGGVIFREQSIKPAVAESNGSILYIAVMGFLIPTIYGTTSGRTTEGMESLSFFIAVVMLLVYFLFLFFQLVTHASMYEMNDDDDENDETHEESKVSSVPVATTILLVSCLFVSRCSDYLVESVSSFSSAVGLNTTFVSLVLLPLVGNAAEHFSAVSVAMKDKMDLSIGIAVGSSIQIAIFVAPFLVVVSKLAGFSVLTLSFNVFETAMVLLSVMLVNTCLRDLSTNWLEGVVLLSAYAMVAIATTVL
mmetsp:Transcript_6219/g.12280  ORF Transcript_6219/g.12280 Transcript_6219/m.12280 type:complete len:393 (+) Transcript_6219:294-1472(+)